MADPLAVSRRGWSDRRRSRAGWAIGLVAYVAMILAVWPSLEGNDSFADVAADYPDALKALFGGNEAFDAITTPTGFLGSYVFSFMLPLLLVVMAIGLGAALIGEEQEDGLVDLTLAQPVTRRRLVLEKGLVVTGQVVALTGVVAVVVLIGGPAVDLDVAVSGVLAASVGSALYGVASGLVALLAGAATGRRSAGLAVGAVVAGIGYLATTLAELATWAEPLRHISLLHHATAGDPVQNGMPGNYLVLVAVSVAVLGATVWVFDRRDLT